MGELIQQLVNGLSLGAVYALIALGYTMVYGVLRFINFAHGDVFMFGAFMGVCLYQWLKPIFPEQCGFLLGIVVLLGAMVLAALLGILLERLAYKPLRARPRITVLITAIGVSLFLEYSCQLIFGAAPKGFPSLIESRSGAFWGVRVSNIQLMVVVVTACLLLALRGVVLRTRMGLAMRAVSLNPTAATLMGVNLDRVISFTFGLGSALAAAGGIFYASLYQAIDPFMGVLPGMKAFVAAVLGGIGVLPGAALGGILLGLIETLVVGYSKNLGISPSYRDAVAFVILILILLFKPTGLLGKSQKEKV
ncbi:MAG: hypothetical protein RLZZ399_146 [Verrucomicrobiota bacterium]